MLVNQFSSKFWKIGQKIIFNSFYDEGEERDFNNEDGGKRNIRCRTWSEGEGIEDSREGRELRTFGDIELKKRKPPDGEVMCMRHKGN